jgi:hypothetical protein
MYLSLNKQKDIQANKLVLMIAPEGTTKYAKR